MNEAKEYFVFEADGGRIRISEDVVVMIAVTAACETDGVAGLSAGGQEAALAELFTKKAGARGLKLTFGERNCCEVELHVQVRFGAIVAEVGRNVQQNVKNAIESMTGITVSGVNVSIAGVLMPKQEQK